MTIAPSEVDMLTVYTSMFPTSKQPQPFPLQGSKRGQVPVINALIPPGKPRLIEPFCGSAAVSIGARTADVVGDVVISDSNADLMLLWKAILEEPEQLAVEYAEIWRAQFDERGTSPNPRGYFNEVRERYNTAAPGTPAELLFILNRIVKAALRYGRHGKINQSADGRRTGAKPDVVRKRITQTHHLLRDATAVHRDWMEAIRSANTDDVIYMDPPYQGTTDTRDKRYISGLGVDDFESGVREGVARDLSMVISYDALRGLSIYGRPLDPNLGLLPLDVITGVSAQGTLLGRKEESHETIYLSPSLVERLGGEKAVRSSVSPLQESLPGMMLGV
ncbi:DNA adenine methylase [Nesterenkonia alba]|uniref:DNA adenine methylase n=1 Tax=Nesterenkonia alba TaxID=515814 RepID=UPI0003B5F02F|nr:DNA adenine methylase [Nesterenkonia alba]